MRPVDQARWERRLGAKLRIVEDCLQRCLDVLEAVSPDVDRIWYVKKQVDMAHDHVIDAQSAAHVLHPSIDLQVG